MTEKVILTELTKQSFTENLQNNKGVFIIKFGAEWCGPCKKIEPLVQTKMNELSENATCAIIDIDDNFEIYAALKSKRVVNGIPVILCYKKGNFTHVPDDVVVGADNIQIDTFFHRCKGYLQ
jgi:thioredoxin 1